MKKIITLLILIIVSAIGSLYYFTQDKSYKTAFKIIEYSRDDFKYSPNTKNIMIGSSSILKMDASAYLQCGRWLNRGLASSKISDVLSYINLSQYFLMPDNILIYVGENDIAYGDSVDETVRNFIALVRRIDDLYPESSLHVLAIKPSPGRRVFFNDFNAVNSQIETYIKQNKNMYFHRANWSDVTSNLTAGYFQADKVHLTSAGYKVFTQSFNESCH